MILKLKTNTDQLRNGWNLAWYHHFTHISCPKKFRGWRKKHKLDHLFPSIRVSDENSSVTNTFHFFKFISTPIFLCVQYEAIKDTSSNFKPFWLHLLVFMHLVIILAKWSWNWKPIQINSEMVETWHGIIISHTYHVLKSWEGYGKN